MNDLAIDDSIARLYGPTTGDRLRLADTDLIVEIERDLTGYGDELFSAAAKSSAMRWVSIRRSREPTARSIP